MRSKLGLFLQVEMKYIDYMSRCIQLAASGKGWVNPNPLVGALVVYQDQIVSEGYHHAFGEAHAETHAILAIKDSHILQNSTLYVSLEPCSHFGKTPPCANLIIEAKIPTVVVAMADPNPLVSGSGIRRLREAGITVIEGIGEVQARALNRFFIKFHQEKRPFVIAKWAETRNGFIAPLPKKEVFISGADTRVYAHALRQEVSAVLVGVGTWEIDNPELSDRFHGGPQPIRVVLDPKAIGTYERAVNAPAQTWVITETRQETRGNVHFFALPGISASLQVLMDFFYEKNINSILVEGGAPTLNRFFDKGLIDEIHRFQHREIKFDSGILAPAVGHLKHRNQSPFENSDLFVYDAPF
jgi:diaminohydroxyphosphoribosylaminopyrimidine deaminase/5-amino-6-(5-phosphoribosylamino)uracil reductase